MMRRTNLALILASLGVLGCAALRPDLPAELNAAARLERGLDALQAGAYSDAFDHLTWVYVECAGQVRGSQALVALAALELDPRNPQARPAVGTSLLARSIRDAGTPAWTRPALEASYLMALSLGAPAPPDAEAAAEAEAEEAEVVGDTVRTEEVERPADVVPEPAEAARPADEPGPFGIGRQAQEDVRPYGCGEAVPAADTTMVALPTLPGPSMAELLSQTEVARDTASARAARLATELLELRARLAETEQELERIRRTLRP